MTESYILLLYLGVALGGAISAYRSPYTLAGGGIFYLTAIPIVVGLGQLFLPQALPWSSQLALFLGYGIIVQLWLNPSRIIELTPEEQTEISGCFGADLFQLESLQSEPGRIVCLGKFRGDRYQLIQQQLQERLDRVFPVRFYVTLTCGIFQPPSCYILPVARSSPLVLACSRGLAVVGAVLLSQNSWVYGLFLILILGAREWTRARIGSKLNLSPLFTMPGGIDFPVVGMGRNLGIPPGNRRAYFWLGVAPAVTGLVLSLLLLIPAWILAPSVEGEIIFPSWLGQILGAKLQGLPPWGRAGWHGLIITALGLLPIGSLEGGHLLHSLLGRSRAVLIGRISRIVLFALSWSHYQILLAPACLLLFLDIDRLPALNDLDELSEQDDLIAIGLLFIGLLILFPVVG